MYKFFQMINEIQLSKTKNVKIIIKNYREIVPKTYVLINDVNRFYFI